MMEENKIIIYQVLPRLFGNRTTTNSLNGSIDKNGCGKFEDFTDTALRAIKDIGITHIWYTGILAHASKTDYTKYGIPAPNPEIVKGVAGSPYAIRDYYDVNPDLAIDVDKRMEEFEELIERTHQNEMKVIIDFVPNHLARDYYSIKKPNSIEEFGAADDNNFSFSPNNNFYYIVDHSLDLSNILVDDKIKTNYVESPAKATGNDCFSHQPTTNDWYETIKLNYGVDYLDNHSTYFSPIPDTWHKMKEILLFWASKQIDGIRCDMAEMVPIEFWKWVIPLIKAKHPEIIFIAEIYNKQAYREYLSENAFDYLYDKVGIYDTVRDVSCGYRPASDITFALQDVGDIQQNMLNFIENHDEQRVASSFFLNNADKGVAAMVLTASLNTNPIMIYFGQELGEKGMDKEGFSGEDGRTSIFDYWSLDKIVRWNNNGKWNNEKLTNNEKRLKDTYTKLLHICNRERAIYKGRFYDLMYANYENIDFDSTKQFAFLRGTADSLLLIVVNFSDKDVFLNLNIPNHAFKFFECQRQDVKNAISLFSENNHATFNSINQLELHVHSYGGDIYKLY